ncbi:hypothetical protein [Streptomyces sp. 8K308]|uniref:hypothetical protein n=1 Tax=Streptomyces sp. 8K308 TaxID=2530388 RepID=UPI0014050234|nr:hypothetical protein [Streptomyces sp. 8K308]
MKPSTTWSGYGRELCDGLGTFFGSRTQQTFDWPLAKDGRRHVRSRIGSAELPARHEAAADLAWLTATHGTA